jgi:hypothetical protein
VCSGALAESATTAPDLRTLAGAAKVVVVGLRSNLHFPQPYPCQQGAALPGTPAPSRPLLVQLVPAVRAGPIRVAAWDSACTALATVDHTLAYKASAVWLRTGGLSLCSLTRPSAVALTCTHCGTAGLSVGL